MAVIFPDSTFLGASALGGCNLTPVNLILTKYRGQVKESQLETCYKFDISWETQGSVLLCHELHKMNRFGNGKVCGPTKHELKSTSIFPVSVHP